MSPEPWLGQNLWRKIMSPFQTKVEDLLSKKLITQKHYDAVSFLFPISDDRVTKSVCDTLQAEVFLLTSPCNRKQPPQNIAQLTNQIANGEFHSNNFISFNDKGELRDGHGRCTACINAGKSFPTRIVLNLPDEEFGGIDSGAPRGPGDEMVFQKEFEQQYGRAATKRDFGILRYVLVFGQSPFPASDWHALSSKSKRELLSDLEDEFAFINQYSSRRANLAVTSAVLGAFIRTYHAVGVKERLKLQEAIELLHDVQKLNSCQASPEVITIRELWQQNTSQADRSGSKSESKLFDRTTRKLHKFLFGKEKNHAFQLSTDVLAKAKAHIAVNLKYDVDLLPPLLRWTRTQASGKIKTKEVVDGIIQMGYKAPFSTVAEKLRKLITSKNYRVDIPSYGILLANVDINKTKEGKRVRCDEFEIRATF